MPDKERPVRLDYKTLFPPDTRPELDLGDLHIQLGLALRHIEGVADVLAKSLQTDGYTGWTSSDAQHPLEVAYDPDGVLSIYVRDKVTGSKDPRFLCYTSTNSGRREIYAIVVNDPIKSQTELLQSLPLLARTPSLGFAERVSVPRSWSDITIESFGLGLSRGPFDILPGSAPRQSGDRIVYSKVGNMHLVVGGRWKNGKGSGEEEIVAYVADVEWDFDLEGFVSAHGRKGGISRALTDEEVIKIPLLGTDEESGLLDPVVAAFVAPAKAKNIPINMPQSLGETGRRGIRRAVPPGKGGRRISLLSLGSEEDE